MHNVAPSWPLNSNERPSGAASSWKLGELIRLRRRQPLPLNAPQPSALGLSRPQTVQRVPAVPPRRPLISGAITRERPAMSDERKASHAIPAAVIGAIATVLAGIIPAVMLVGQRDGSTSTSNSPAVSVESPASASAPTAGASDEPSSLGNDIDLNHLADSCYAGNWSACDELYVLAPVGSDYEWYGGTCGGILDWISDDTCETLVILVDQLAELAADCQVGDLHACDELYFQSPVGSNFEFFGATCGTRLDFVVNGSCWELS